MPQAEDRCARDIIDNGVFSFHAATFAHAFTRSARKMRHASSSSIEESVPSGKCAPSCPVPKSPANRHAKSVLSRLPANAKRQRAMWHTTPRARTQREEMRGEAILESVCARAPLLGLSMPNDCCKGKG